MKRSRGLKITSKKKFKPKHDPHQLIRPWLNLYLKYKRVLWSSTDDFRQFKAWLGVAPEVAEMIFVRYQDQKGLPHRARLALVLHFLKHMLGQQEAASLFLITPPTYRKYLWTSLNYLDRTMDEVCIVYLLSVACFSPTRFLLKIDFLVHMQHNLTLFFMAFTWWLMPLTAQSRYLQTSRPS